jgi:hypothetical protein
MGYLRKHPTQHRPTGGWRPEDFQEDVAPPEHHNPPCEFDRFAERNWMWITCLPLDITDEATEAMSSLFEVLGKKGIL